MENSKIEWTNNTFNPWWGCTKVSDGCKFCYAEALDHRYNMSDPHWGPSSTRKPMSERYWKQLDNWNKEAKATGINLRVFVASMADVFEWHSNPAVNTFLIHERNRLFNTIEQTPHLTYQLLTKRPENIMTLVPDHWQKRFPENVWIGTSVEDQPNASRRIPHLLKIPATVRFLSMEPLLGPVDLIEFFIPATEKLAEMKKQYTDDLLITGQAKVDMDELRSATGNGIDWIIVGGESGHSARPMHPDWVRNIRDITKDAGIPFLFKQWGEWIPFSQTDHITTNVMPLQSSYLNPDGIFIKPVAKPIKFEDTLAGQHAALVLKIGKKKSGNLLDGIQHINFPTHSHLSPHTEQL